MKTAIKSKEKQKIREVLASLLFSGDKAFTLPSEEFLFEKEVLKEKNIEFYCAENNYEIYQRALTKAKKVGIKDLFYTNAFDYLMQSGKKFNFIWLDLCSSFNHESFYKSLSICREQEGVFAVTFFLKRTRDLDMFEKIYGVKNTEELLKKFISLIRFFKPNYEVLAYRYNSTKYTPMVTVLVYKL